MLRNLTLVTQYVTLAKIMVTSMSLATFCALLGVLTGETRFLSASLVSGNVSGLAFQIRSAKNKH